MLVQSRFVSAVMRPKSVAIAQDFDVMSALCDTSPSQSSQLCTGHQKPVVYLA